VLEKYSKVLAFSLSKYVGLPYCQAEIYAGRVSCCVMVSIHPFVRSDIVTTISHERLR